MTVAHAQTEEVSTGVDLRVYLPIHDLQPQFAAYLGTEDDTIPQTLVFNRKGQVVLHLSGYSDSHARALDEAINRAIAGS